MKILGAFWSYLLNSTANPAHLPHNWAKLAKSAPRILIAMGADYSFYVKSIAAFALTFLGYIISVLASVLFLSLIFGHLPFIV